MSRENTEQTLCMSVKENKRDIMIGCCHSWKFFLVVALFHCSNCESKQLSVCVCQVLLSLSVILYFSLECLIHVVGRLTLEMKSLNKRKKINKLGNLIQIQFSGTSIFIHHSFLFWKYPSQTKLSLIYLLELIKHI